MATQTHPAERRNPALQPPTTVSQPTAAKKKESKADAFKRLMNQRVPKALAALASIERLFSPTSYQWTEHQANTVILALHAVLDSIKDASKGKKPAASGFHLD